MSLPPLPKLRQRPGLKPVIGTLPPDIPITTTGGVDDEDELDNIDEVSISPTFYVRLFHSKVFSTAFLLLQFGFEIF